MFAAIAAAVSILSSQAGLPTLSCQGEKIVDPSGHEVRLRGVNLGGWFVEEIWMTPFAAKKDESSPELIKDHVSLWRTVEDRLGADAMVRIRNAYRENWITNEDFARIHRLGFNHVRLPFLSSILDEPGGMHWLHQAVDMAKANGLYVVLDMHGLPGGQSVEHHTGEEGKNRLWFDVDNITKAEQAWATVAKEFADEPAVAAYDLINEPMGAPNPAMLFIVYDRLIRAVRKVDPNKIILVEDGYKGFDTTPHPNLAQWTQVAYSLHFYDFDAKAPGDHAKTIEANAPKLKELQGYRQTPLYIGEFETEPQGTPDATLQVLKAMDSQDWSWCIWTYKTMAVTGPMGQWGLYRLSGPADAINVFTDTEADILAKFRKMRTENMAGAPGILEMFENYFKNSTPASER